jgi:hypothetical protein
MLPFRILLDAEISQSYEYFIRLLRYRASIQQPLHDLNPAQSHQHTMLCSYLSLLIKVMAMFYPKKLAKEIASKTTLSIERQQVTATIPESVRRRRDFDFIATAWANEETQQGR